MRHAVRAFLLIGLFGAQTLATPESAFLIGDSGQRCMPEVRRFANAPHGVFVFGAQHSEPDCEKLMLAQSLLSRRIDQTKLLLSQTEEVLGQFGEYQRLLGRVAYRMSDVSEALGLLAPKGVIYRGDLGTLWETAIVAAEAQKNELAKEAYLALLEGAELEPREQLAIRLELAVVLSRGSQQDYAMLLQLLDDCDKTCTMPDNAPWVQAVTQFTFILMAPMGMQGASRVAPPPLETKHARYLRRAVTSERGVGLLSGPIALEKSWLHLSRNERRAVLALAVQGEDLRLAEQLFAGISDVRDDTPLAQYLAQRQAAQGK
jgi:hypothetical protein